MNEIRRFTESGMAAARLLVNQLRQGDVVDHEHLLTSSQHSVSAGNLDYEVCEFSDREHAGRFFFELLDPLTEHYPNLEFDANLWTWLSLKWLDVLAPRDDISGARKVGQIANYVLTPNDYNTYYRHYLSGPYRIYKAHREHIGLARAVLATPVSAPGEVVEQLASRQDIISNPTLLGVATHLYIDSSTNQLKRGSGGSKAGSPRRLSEVLGQLDQTWDSAAMQVEEVVKLLPEEFSKFKSL